MWLSQVLLTGIILVVLTKGVIVYIPAIDVEFVVNDGSLMAVSPAEVFDGVFAERRRQSTGRL